MPRATISTDSERHDLRTLEGAFVELRRMPYGKWLERNEMAMHISVEQQRGKKGMGGELKIANLKVTAFEFKQCVVTHNLEDDNGELLDLTKEATLMKLDPKVGNEIGELINSMHQFEDDLGN